jgi:RecJ-like exonuclease
VHPASEKTNAIARIHTTSYTGATVEGISVTVSLDPDTSGVLTKSTIAVDSDGTKNESVIADITSTNTATGNVILTPLRGMLIYESNGSTWIYQSTTSY